MSLEICLMDDCSVWTHNDCLNKSGGGYRVVCWCVRDTVCLKKLLTENNNFGGLMFKMDKKFCYQTVLEVKYELG